MPDDSPTPEQPQAEIDRITSDPAYWKPKDSNVSQRESEALHRLYQIAAGTNTPILRVDGTHVTTVPPREELDLTGIPTEDQEAAKAFHAATDGQNVITRRWLEYAAMHTPIEDEGEAWAVLNKLHGQGAGPLVWDARQAYHHKDFPASLKRFIERRKLENDVNVIVRLAQWYRDRQGK